MNRHSAAIFAVAVGASLVAHGVLWTTTHGIHVDYGMLESNAGQVHTPRRLGPITITLNSAGEPKNDFPAPVDRKPQEPKSLADELPKVDPPKPEPKPPKPDPEKLPDRIGRQDGEGIGTHEAKGAQPLQAREADNDQPSLSRDPRGPDSPKEPTQSTVMPGEGGTGGRAGASAVAEILPAPPARPPTPKPVEHAEQGEPRPGPVTVRVPTSETGQETQADRIDPRVSVRDRLTAPRAGLIGLVPEGDRPDQVSKADGFLPPPPSVRLAKSPPPAPLPMKVSPEAAMTPPAPALPTPPVQAAVVPSTVTQGTTDGANGRPGPQAAADPAQQSDSEVDPFSKIGTWTIPRDGAMAVQFGRQVRPVRPRLNIAGMIDASLGARAVALRVHIAADGHVTAVDVEQGSGSNEVDQPCVIAMYDWWFEPLKDKNGHPMPDVVQFVLKFR